MKVTSYLLIIISLVLVAACSSNAKKEVEVEIIKTPVELAAEAVMEAEAAYSAKDFQIAIEKFDVAVNYLLQALPTASPADSLPQQIHKLRNNIANTHSAYAMDLSGQNLFDDAIVEYETAIAKYQELKREATTTESLDDTIGLLYRNTAVACRQAGEFEKSLNYYDLYLEKNPEADDVLLQKFLIYRDDLKNEVQAFEVLKEYANSRNDFNASHSLGDRYMEKDDVDNALIWYEKAYGIKQDPNVLKKIGSAYRTQQKWAESNKAYEQFLVLNPSVDEMKSAYKIIGSNYDKLKNKTKAVEFYDKFLNLEYAEDLSLYICNYHFEGKRYQKSIEYATSILNKNYNNATARYLRALARFSLNDKKGAKVDFELIKDDPKYGTQAKQYLKSI